MGSVDDDFMDSLIHVYEKRLKKEEKNARAVF